MEWMILVGVVVGYILGLLNGGIKVSIQHLPEMKDTRETDKLFSGIAGSKEHIEYIAKIRRENNKE